jgi:hypothetical protein
MVVITTTPRPGEVDLVEGIMITLHPARKTGTPDQGPRPVVALVRLEYFPS